MATQLIPKKISSLPGGGLTPATGGEFFPVSQGGTTKRATPAWLKEYIGFSDELKTKLSEGYTNTKIDEEIATKADAYHTHEASFLLAENLGEISDNVTAQKAAQKNLGLEEIDPLAYYILAKN